MSSDDDEHEAPMVNVDPEIKELLGLFDVPAFARRGQELEYTLRRMHDHCRQRREEMLEMVHLRLRQWSKVAAGPEDWAPEFTAPIDSLWILTKAAEPSWAGLSAPPRQRRAVARDLKSSIERFNERWGHFLDALNLDPANKVIDQYNQYYVLEKECVMGSARLAARYFTAIPRLSPASLRQDHPHLPVPELNEPSRTRPSS
jgi:hypothetical protein